MFAIIEAGGRQYQVSPGDTIEIEKIPQKPGEKVIFDRVLLTAKDKGKGDAVEIGGPYLKGASVEAEVLAQSKWKKLIVFKKRPKKRYQKKQGHRQPFTKVRILKIKT